MRIFMIWGAHYGTARHGLGAQEGTFLGAQEGTFLGAQEGFRVCGSPTWALSPGSPGRLKPQPEARGAGRRRVCQID